MSAETFLLEAEERGKETERLKALFVFQCAHFYREVYCHVVGLGLGVWQVNLMT